MGLISFAFQGNYKRYYNDLKELSKQTHKNLCEHRLCGQGDHQAFQYQVVALYLQ